MKVTLSTALVGATLLFSVASANPSSPLIEREDLELNERHWWKKNIHRRSPASLCKSGVDYVILGGGTAGLVLASRLSEDGRNTVAVLEAGGSAKGDPRVDIPGYFGAGLGTVYDWNYTTVASENAPSIGWPRGKVLGGSSALNFLVWDRPTARRELDAWEQLGSSGWNWRFLYNYMKKAETFNYPSQSQRSQMNFTPDASDYGYSGPLQASYPFYISKQVQRWIKAVTALGIRVTPDMDGTNIGAAQQPGAINPVNSTRSYSASAYLWPAGGRRNLNVIQNALVDKINFDSNLKATSVTFLIDGARYTLPIQKEVIVSGGAVGSPAILERSGVGKKEVLDQAGVKQLIELPVGENLQDHTYTAAAYELQQPVDTLDSLRNNATFAAEQMALYKQNSRNPASILTEVVPSIAYLTLEELVGKTEAAALVTEADAWAKASTAPHKATLDKQVEFLKAGANEVGQMEIIGVDGYFAGSAPPEAGKNYVTFLAAQQHLLSRGSIHIRSSDPNQAPAIAPNYYDAPWDLKVASAGTSYLRKVAATEAYSSYIVKEAVPGSQDITKYTQTTFSTEYHPMSSCSMLPRGKGGVVDSKLKVYGTRNVRVADASIAPLHVSAHIQALVYGIAEAAADIVKRENSYYW